MKKKKNLILSVLLVVGIVALGYFAVNTYARYASSIAGNTTVSAAVWEITVNGDNVAEEDTFTNNLTLTLNDSDVVVKDKIAPGRGGYVQFAINPNGTEVAFQYTATLGALTAVTGNLPLAADFSVTGYEVSETVEGFTGTPTAIVGGTFTDSTSFGTLPGTDNNRTPFTAVATKYVRVYFDWEDNGNNAEDTSAEGSQFSVPVTIALSQIVAP